MSRLWLVVLLLLPASPCLAQSGGGAVPIRIPDGVGTRCINGGNDRIWLTLRRVITNKTSGWFTEDKSVATLLNAQVRADPESRIAFPLMTETTIANFPNGQVSVPLEYTLVSGLNLAQTGVKYTGLNVDVTLLNKRGKNKWGNALNALKEITQKLPIPASPVTQAASYLMDFANNAVTKDIDGQAMNDKVKSGTLALNFDPTGSCRGSAPDGSDFETTGTIAIVQGDGVPGPDFVDIGKSNDYCWSAELRPAFIVKAAPKEGTRPCTDASYATKARQISNNYVAFFLNARAVTPSLRELRAADWTQSMARCAANGVAAEECLP